MDTMTRQEVKALLDEMGARVPEWDEALIRQAVLVVGLWRGEFSANDFRELLPQVAPGAIGLVIRQLPSQRHGCLLEKATTEDGHTRMVPSSAASTHGKPLQVWRLTEAGRRAARNLVSGVAA